MGRSCCPDTYRRTGVQYLEATQDNPDDNRVLVAPTAAATPSQNPESTSPGDTNGIVWEAGIGEDAMINPIFLTIAPDGTIWIPDSGRNQIRIYSTDGELLDTWGETGSGNGQFDFARSPGDPTSALSDVAFDREGNFYIVDPGNKRVQKFAPDRTFLLAWGSGGTGDGQFADPVTVNIGLNDVVYVSDDVLNTVQMFDSNGQFLGRFGSFGTAPGQMDSGAVGSIDGDGNVWYADTLNNRVQVFSPDGEFLYGFGEVGMGAGQFLNLNDVFAAPNGLIYVSDFEAFRIQVFTAEGKLLSFWLAQDQSSHLIGVAVDEAGYMYVAKPETGTLIKVKPDVPAEPFDGTKVVNPISAKPQPAAATTDWSVDLSASGGGVPSSITVAPDGTIWVPDETNDTIVILDADGVYQESWGASGTGPGQFAFGEDTIADAFPDNISQVIFLGDESFFVSDPGNNRVQIFAADRTYLSEFTLAPADGAQEAQVGPMLLLPDGTIGIVDAARNTDTTFDLVTFDSTGTLLARTTYAGRCPILFLADGSYWAYLGTGPIWMANHFDKTGESVGTLFDGDGVPAFFSFAAVGATDESGNLYIPNPEGYNVSAWSPDGTFINAYTGDGTDSGPFRFPRSVAVNSAGTVYVSDYEKQIVTKFEIQLP